MTHHPPNTTDPYDDTVPASALRETFERRIGAHRDVDSALWRELDRVIVAYLDARDAEADERVKHLCLHFPGLTPALLVAWEHVKLENALVPCGVCETGA